jgi:hypothetical protein
MVGSSIQPFRRKVDFVVSKFLTLGGAYELNLNPSTQKRAVEQSKISTHPDSEKLRTKLVIRCERAACPISSNTQPVISISPNGISGCTVAPSTVSLASSYTFYAYIRIWVVASTMAAIFIAICLAVSNLPTWRFDFQLRQKNHLLSRS